MNLPDTDRKFNKGPYPSIEWLGIWMSHRISILLCLLIAGLFSALSYRAALSKSPTWDEPLHAASAYAHTYSGDGRLDPENPPLWKWWAMIPVRRGEMLFDQTDPSWRATVDSGQALSWSAIILFRHLPN